MGAFISAFIGGHGQGAEYVGSVQSLHLNPLCHLHMFEILQIIVIYRVDVTTRNFCAIALMLMLVFEVGGKITTHASSI